MGRTRAGLLAGAARAFAEHGLRRSTMQSIAAAAGVAKATLYNHFRTKDDVAAALLAVELDRLSALAASLPREQALAALSDELGAHPVLRRLAARSRRRSPRCSPSDRERWAELTARLGAALRVDDDGAELAARWLLGVVLQPGRSTTRHRHAGRLAAVLAILTRRRRQRPGQRPVRARPAWSRQVRARAERGVEGRAAAFGRVTAWTTRAPVPPGRRTIDSRRPAPTAPVGSTASMQRPAGRRSRRRGRSRRPLRRPSWPPRRSRRTGGTTRGGAAPGCRCPRTGRASSSRSAPPSRTARRSRRGESSVTVRRGRPAPPGWVDRRRPACS